jgi:hypothetical protein
MSNHRDPLLFPLGIGLLVLIASAGCTSSIAVMPQFQTLPTLALVPTPGVRVEPDGFRFCYRNEPCALNAAMGGRYQAMVQERFPSGERPVRVITEMRLIDDHQGRFFSYGLLFGPLAFLAPIPYPMALDFLTVSTTLDAEGKPIRVYRSRQLLEFWTYSAWGLRDPKLVDAAMRHHLRALERNLQFDITLYQPPLLPATDADDEAVEPPAEPPQAEAAPAASPVSAAPRAEPAG